MHLPYQFYKFPFQFDVEKLQAEAAAIPADAWIGHPSNYKGNTALPLISTNGDEYTAFRPPMKPTKYLEQSPYIQQILSQFRTLLGRARFMRLEPGDGVPPHFDVHYYWRTHTRVHIPVITHEDVRFHCGRESVHMKAGEAWTFDNWRSHQVTNKTPVRRIHLTFDTYGSSAFWALAQPWQSAGEPTFVPYQEGAKPLLLCENYVGDPVMSPSELDLELIRLVTDISANPENKPEAVAQVQMLTTSLRNDWRMLWHLQGPTPQGVPMFNKMVEQVVKQVRALPAGVKMASNGMQVGDALLSTAEAMVKSAQPQALLD